MEKDCNRSCTEKRFAAQYAPDMRAGKMGPVTSPGAGPGPAVTRGAETPW